MDAVLAAGGLAFIAILSILSDTGLIALVAAGVAVLLIPAACYTLLLFFALLLGLSFYMNEIPVTVGGFNWYGADGMIYLLGAAAVFETTRFWTKKQLHENDVQPYRGPLYKVELAFVAYGVLALAIGLFVYGHGFNEVFGDFRRFFFYSLALIIPLWLPLRNRHFRLLPVAIWAGFAGAVSIGLYRLITGQTYREMQFIVMATEPSPRLLGYAAVITLCAALAYFLASMRIPGLAPFKVFNLLGAAVCVSFLLLSGWRLAAGYAVVVPIFTLVMMTWIRRQPFRGLLFTFLIGGVLLVLTAGLMTVAIPEAVQQSFRQLEERVTSFSLTTDLRYYTWQEALKQFAQHPIFGAGLGHQLLYAAWGSEGTFIYYESSTHNTVLAILYQSGLVGIALFALLHVGFLVMVFRRIRDLRTPIIPVVVGLLSLYLCAFGFSALQPLFPGSIVLLYLSMGIVFACVHAPCNRVDAHTQPAAT